MSVVGFVVIGRNEGERLQRCLQSAKKLFGPIVYVDSASDDDSVAYAKSIGVDVVELDMSIPFSAARARNEGVQALTAAHPTVEFVQFVDGDCEIEGTWMSKALIAIQADEKLACVCGRRRERYPSASIYNLICDIEWNTPIGIAESTGGDFICRIKAFKAVGGFNPNVVAGEEPEMCFRLRKAGWKIERIEADMTLHDANIHRFSEWWKRVERSGHATAQGASLHGKSVEKYRVKRSIGTLFWGLGIPAIILISTFLFGWVGLLTTLIYPVQIFRIFKNEKKRIQRTPKQTLIHSFFIVLGKSAEAYGWLKFHWRKMTGKQITILEYKGASS